MNWKKVGLYVVLALAALLVVRVVVSTVLAFVGFLWAAVTTGVTLAILLGIAYGVYRGISWLRSGDPGVARSAEFPAGESRSADDPDDSVDRVTERYVEGDLSEAELEARLDDTLDEAGRDDIDRELERSRSE